MEVGGSSETLLRVDQTQEHILEDSNFIVLSAVRTADLVLVKWLAIRPVFCSWQVGDFSV
jgi:hypothetical protein